NPTADTPGKPGIRCKNSICTLESAPRRLSSLQEAKCMAGGKATKATSPLSSEQVQQLERLLPEVGGVQASTIHSDVHWFLPHLGLGDHYFNTTPLPLIAQHVASLVASRILNRSRGGE